MAIRYPPLAVVVLGVTVAFLGSPLVAQRSGPFTIVESGQGFARLADAVAAIGAGTGTILIAPGSYRQCAVQEAGRITYRAATSGTAVFERTACEDKAALVLRGRAATVDGIVFRGIRVPDANGAGIRIETGALSVVNSMFLDSEQGILSADDPAAAISVDRSTFAGLGRCDRGLSCAHGIYVGHYGALSVTRSRFERGNGGHYVKSRAPRIAVTDSSFDDSAGHATNYMIDLPAGATGTITGNTFVQGRDKENYSAFIAVAAEAREQVSAGLLIVGNSASIVPGVARRTTFVVDWSHEALRIEDNRLGAGVAAFATR
ncbi:right-handed parallel beta-helix repeat-containing protein [Sphingomonas flavalba]|uniref:right-handed parallel beta-helix repeat-containing protein n=1 Tax=Sphingomonas flavalba TaxID=2559804 RepID=UPI00109DFE9A|nr:right-handed parallel beta-helix repeat-containing protein [Sphingomonas flavalba]